MRAAQSFGVDDIRFVADAPDPEPFETDAIVKTEMASLCGSDLHMVGKGWQMPEYPAPPGHPGHEGVGIVEEPPQRYPERRGHRHPRTGRSCLERFHTFGTPSALPNTKR